jgi:hypothetical protein
LVSSFFFFFFFSTSPSPFVVFEREKETSDKEEVVE